MTNDQELQADVQNAIKWELSFHAQEIVIIAKHGVVSLTGSVNSLPIKRQAIDTAKKSHWGGSFG